jgi:hypothetical protein
MNSFAFLSLVLTVDWLKDGFSPLWIACQRGHFAIVKYLVEKRDARLDYRSKVW